MLDVMYDVVLYCRDFILRVLRRIIALGYQFEKKKGFTRDIQDHTVGLPVPDPRTYTPSPVPTKVPGGYVHVRCCVVRTGKEGTGVCVAMDSNADEDSHCRVKRGITAST